jgi:hypothetical protein
MFFVGAAVAAVGAVGAAVAAVREGPRFARWYRRAAAM